MWHLASGIGYRSSPGRPKPAQRRQKLRRPPVFRRLLEGVRDRDELRLAPRSPEERDSNRKSVRKTRRNVDVGVARDRCRSRARTHEVIAIDEIDRPRWTRRRRNERIETVLRHHSIDSLRARHRVVMRKRIATLLRRQRSLLLRANHQLLPEIRHLARLVSFIECNDVRESADGRLRSE